MKKITGVLLLSIIIFSSCGEKNIPIPEEKADITSTVTVTEAAATTAVTTSVPVTSESSATSLVTSSVTVSAVSETSADSVPVNKTADKTELPLNTDSSAEHSETKTESKITVTRQNDVTEEEKIQTLPEETTVTEATTTVNDIIINDDGSINLPEVFF